MKAPPMNKTAHPKKQPSQEWVKRAERAFKVVAKQVRAETKLHGLKPLEWKD